MCGICGFTGASNHDLLRSMTTSLIHRGPDDEGYYEDDRVSMGCRRLRIIDLEGGRQPMTGEDGSTWLVYNGELYNYPALRRGLQNCGHRFRTNCDTECIVHAYEEFGLNFPNTLSGMFATAIWDARKQRLVLVRDRIGMKPLYYARTADGIVFASEAKALFFHPQVQ